MREKHSPICQIKGDIFDICRCVAHAEAVAQIGAPRLTFTGPVGKNNAARSEPVRDAYDTVRRLFR